MADPVKQIDVPYPFAQFEKEEAEQLFDIFRRDGKDQEQGFAQMLSGTLALENPSDPNYLSYQGLKEGTAGVFSQLPQFADLPPEERKLTDGQILQLFAYDMEGRPFQPGSYTEGGKRGILPGLFSAGAFWTGATATNTAMQANPLTATPVTPWQLGARIVAPIVGGTVAAYGGSEFGTYLTEEMLGKEPILLPSSAYKNMAGQVTTENIGLALLPFTLSGKTSLGALTVADKFTPVVYKGSKKGFVVPRSFKITRGTENLLQRLSEEAYNRPFRFIGAETIASAASGYARGEAERIAPGEMLPAITSEMVGGVTGGIGGDLLLKKTADAWSALAAANRVRKEYGVVEGLKQLRGKNEQEVANFLIDFIGKYSGDAVRQTVKQLDGESNADYILRTDMMAVEQVIENLSDDNLAKALSDYEAATGTKVELTAGVKSRSLPIMALEKALETTSSGIASQRGTANKQAIEAMRLMIVGLWGTADPTAVNQAAKLMQDGFEGELSSQLDARMANLTDAVAKLQTGEAGGDPEQMTALGTRIYDMVRMTMGQNRARERALWSAVPGRIEITSFKGADGSDVDLPNTITVWDTIFSPDAAPESTSHIRNELAPLVAFSERKGSEFGVGGQIGGQAGVPKAVTKFNDALTEAEGTDAYNMFNKMVDQFNLNEPTDDAIRKLAELSRQSTYKGKKSATAKLYDMKRQALIAQRDAGATTAVAATDGGIMTVGELTSMRSRALALARNAEMQGKSDVANAAYRYVTAIDNDLNSLPEGTNLEYDIARSFSRAFNDVYTRGFAGDVVAKDATGALRIAPEQLGRIIFSGSDGGYLRAKDLDGIGRFQLEQSMTNLLMSQGEEGSALLNSAKSAAIDPETGMFNIEKLRGWVQENKDALEALPGYSVREVGEGQLEAVAGGTTLLNNINDTVQATQSIRGTMDSILRNIKAEAFDPADPSKVNPAALRKWMSKSENEVILKAFPDLADDLNRIIDGDEGALALFNGQVARNKQITQEMRGKYSFYSLINDKSETPAGTISKAINLSNDRPIRNLESLWLPVKNAPDEWVSPATGETFLKTDAVNGFKSSVLDAVFLNSGLHTNNFSPNKAYQILFMPNQRAVGKKRLAEWLVDNDVFTSDEMKNLEDMMGMMMDFENTIFNGSAADVDGLMAKMGPSADLILSVLGSSAGMRLQAMLPGDTGAGSLIAAGRGASAFRSAYSEVFSKMPNVLKMDLLREIVKDPEMLALTLRKGKTESERNRIGSRMMNWMIDNGFAIPRRTLPGAVVPLDEPPAEIEPEVIEESSVQMPVAQPPLPTPQAAVPTTALASAAPVQPQPVAPPPVASGPVDRSRYAAMFPTDIASGMIRQQGIGSLMG
jgi:hypothetical protein